MPHLLEGEGAESINQEMWQGFRREKQPMERDRTDSIS